MRKIEIVELIFINILNIGLIVFKKNNLLVYGNK